MQLSSPFHTLYPEQPNYNFLKPFGYVFYQLLRPYNKHRLDLCFFIGYSPQHKGYKCLSTFGRIYISRQVVFYENCFPYLSCFSKHSSISDAPLHSDFVASITLIPSTSTTHLSVHNVVTPTSPATHSIPNHDRSMLNFKPLNLSPINLILLLHLFKPFPLLHLLHPLVMHLFKTNIQQLQELKQESLNQRLSLLLCYLLQLRRPCRTLTSCNP